MKEWIPTDSRNCPWSIIHLLEFSANMPELYHQVFEERGSCFIFILNLHKSLNQQKIISQRLSASPDCETAKPAGSSAWQKHHLLIHPWITPARIRPPLGGPQNPHFRPYNPAVNFISFLLLPNCVILASSASLLCLWDTTCFCFSAVSFSSYEHRTRAKSRW